MVETTSKRKVERKVEKRCDKVLSFYFLGKQVHKDTLKD